MKKLIFLENDYQCPGSDDSIECGKRVLEDIGFSEEEVESMKIQYQFGLLKREEKFDIVFNKENILITSSVYVQGSDYDFCRLLEVAGQSSVTGLTYICTTGMCVELLNKVFTDLTKRVTNPIALFAGVNTNNIIIFDFKASMTEKRVVLKRLRLEVNGYRDKFVVLQDFKKEDL